MRALTMSETYKARVTSELSKIVIERLDAEAEATGVEIEPEDRPLVIQATTEVVMGEAEIEDSGPVERLANRAAEDVIEMVRNCTDDWMLHLVLYNRFMNGEEKDSPQAIIDRAINTVRWLSGKTRVFS